MNNTTTQHDATHKEEEVQKQCKQPTTKPQNHKDNDGGGDDVGRRRHNTLKMPPQLDLRAITMQLGTKWVVAYNRRQVPLQHNAVHTTPGATHIEKTTTNSLFRGIVSMRLAFFVCFVFVLLPRPLQQFGAQ